MRRAAWLVLAAFLVGLAAGGVWTLLQPDRYRAETRVVVRGDARGLVPAVEALAESSPLEQNVAQTLRLDDRPEVSATGGKGGVLTLSVEGRNSERARQLDAEAAIVLGRLAATRFGPDVEVTVLDPAHTVEQTSPTPARNLLIVGLAGLAAGLALAGPLLRRRSAASVDPEVERLRKRIDEVSRRERALAPCAGELAVRESQIAERARELARREGELAARESQATEREQALDAPRPSMDDAGPPAAPPPERPPVVASETPAPAISQSASRWNLDELEQMVRAHGDVPPERAEEWQTYLRLLRGHAAIDGTLPPGFEGLLYDVFGELVPSLERRGSAETQPL